jgi:hypothetical protein
MSGLLLSDLLVEGIVEMMVDAAQRFDLPISKECLFNWPAEVFPTGYSGMSKIIVAG